VSAVVDVREVELLLLGADLHVREGVAELGVAEFVEAQALGLLGWIATSATPLRLVVRDDLLQPFLVGLGVGQWLLGERHDESFEEAKVRRAWWSCRRRPEG
jgi:hypothetical protein